MARILRKRIPGAPGGSTRGLIPSLGGGRVTKDSQRKRGIRRLFARNPASGAFVNIGTAADVLGMITPAKNATLTTAFAGTHNDLKFTAKPAGTVGNGYRVAFVVSGASTPLSVGLSGNDVTVTVQTNGSSVAISTASQVLAALQASAPIMAKFEVALASGNDGSGVVAAMALTNLTGGTQAVGQDADIPAEVGPANPTIVDGSVGKRNSTQTHKNVVNRATNRRIRKR